MTFNKLALLAAAGSLLLTAGFASAAETLRVGKANNASFPFAVVDVGVAAGIFEKHGLTLEISSFGGGPKMQQALAAGSVDIGLSTGPDMAGIPKGAPEKAIACILGTLDQVVVVSKDSAIKSVDDLKGKVFSASSPAALSGWLPVTLSKAKGWGDKGVTLQLVNSSQAALALIKTGQLDAMTVDPASAAQGEKSGELRTVYKYSEFMPAFPQYAMFASNTLIAQKPQVIKEFVAAWLETIAYMKANKDTSVKVVADITGVDAAITASVYDSDMPGMSTDGKFDAKALDILLQSFVDGGRLAEKPSPAAVIDDSFLPAHS